MENLYRWLRFSVTLSLVKGPSSVHSTMLGNQSSSTWHCKHQCLNSCCLLGPLSYFFASDMGETAKQHVLGEGASITIFKTTPSNLGMQTYLCHPQSCLLIFNKLFSLSCQFMVVNVLWFGVTNQENILAVIVGPFCHFHLLCWSHHSLMPTNPQTDGVQDMNSTVKCGQISHRGPAQQF